MNVAVEAVSWMTPPPRPSRANESGRPSAWRSWSRTTCSSSVAAGLVAHNIPWAPMPLESRSPSTPAGEEFAGKYAKKRGCCQCVSPGTRCSSRSASTASSGSGCSGSAVGSDAVTSPGCTWARTGISSTDSQ